MTGPDLRSGRPARAATTRRDHGRARVRTLTAVVAAAGLTGAVVVAGNLPATVAAGTSAQRGSSSRPNTSSSHTSPPGVRSGSTHTHATSNGS
jgi:hypothetical protein